MAAWRIWTPVEVTVDWAIRRDDCGIPKTTYLEADTSDKVLAQENIIVLTRATWRLCRQAVEHSSTRVETVLS